MIFKLQQCTDKLTIDESKAELGQCVFFQIFIPVLSVPILLNSPPARYSSDEHQIVAEAGAAQSIFHLGQTEHRRLNDNQSLRVYTLCCCTKSGMLFYNHVDQQVGVVLTLLTRALFCRLL